MVRSVVTPTQLLHAETSTPAQSQWCMLSAPLRVRSKKSAIYVHTHSVISIAILRALTCDANYMPKHLAEPWQSPGRTLSEPAGFGGGRAVDEGGARRGHFGMRMQDVCTVFQSR